MQVSGEGIQLEVNHREIEFHQHAMLGLILYSSTDLKEFKSTQFYLGSCKEMKHPWSGFRVKIDSKNSGTYPAIWPLPSGQKLRHLSCHHSILLFHETKHEFEGIQRLWQQNQWQAFGQHSSTALASQRTKIKHRACFGCTYLPFSQPAAYAWAQVLCSQLRQKAFCRKKVGIGQKNP